MDAQKFYSLSEAYNQVHQLDEVLDTPEKATEYGKKALGSMLGATAKAIITKDKKYLKTVKKRTKGVEAAKRKAEKKAAEEEAKESYDIVISHLLDEGFASTPEAADKIILNMSESWFEEIMESRRMDREGVDRKDPVRAARAERAKQSLDAVAKGEERKIKVSKKYDIEPSKADTVEKRAHKRDFPGSRQAPKEKGKKETPLETHNRKVNRQVDRVIKHGFTSKEKKEGEAMQKWHSPRN